MNATERLTRKAAAAWLADRHPEKNAMQWALFLQNNGSTSRKALYQIPFEQVGRSSFYALGALEDFSKFEKSRQIGEIKLTGRAAELFHAFGISKSGGSGTGRKLEVTSISEQIDEDGQMFIQMLIADPLLVFRLSPEQAITVGRELIEEGERAKSRGEE